MSDSRHRLPIDMGERGRMSPAGWMRGAANAEVFHTEEERERRSALVSNARAARYGGGQLAAAPDPRSQAASLSRVSGDHLGWSPRTRSSGFRGRRAPYAAVASAPERVVHLVAARAVRLAHHRLQHALEDRRARIDRDLEHEAADRLRQLPGASASVSRSASTVRPSPAELRTRSSVSASPRDRRGPRSQ
jgi:hypothetical protein